MLYTAVTVGKENNEGTLHGVLEKKSIEKDGKPHRISHVTTMGNRTTGLDVEFVNDRRGTSVKEGGDE